jgi:hypothetical protein
MSTGFLGGDKPDWRKINVDLFAFLALGRGVQHSARQREL